MVQVNNGVGGVHPQHMQNRIDYAERFIGFLDEHIPGAKAANLAAQNISTWDRMAQIMGEIEPSKETISMIVGMIRMRETIAARVAQVSAGDHRLLSTLPEGGPAKVRV